MFKNSDSNRSSEIEHFEENTAVKERVSGELKMTEGNVQVNRCDMEENIAKSVVVVCPEQMPSKIATVCDNNSEVARHSFHMSKIAQFHSQPSLNLPWTKDSPNDHATCELRRDPNVKKYYIRDLNEDLKRLKMDENGKNLRTIEDIDENSTSAARINHVWNTSHGVEDKTEENCNPLEELSILDQIDQNMNASPTAFSKTIMQMYRSLRN
uniref:Uncharacterized protein n=1 Tax=Setaria digitata TaxID=48799 RepID=A0A915PQU7_9BILA